jgi:prolyl oligopeptidase
MPVTSATASAATTVDTLATVPTASKYPQTPKRPSFDEYFGTRVQDDYRWLEDGTDPAVAAWTREQNELTRRYFEPLAFRAKVRSRVAELLGKRPPSYFEVTVRNTRAFALKSQPPKQQPLLVVFSDPARAASERVVLDPMTIDPTGKTTIDWFVPSVNGTKVAVSLSSSGSERGDVHIYDVTTGRALADVIAHVNDGTAGGSLAWNADGSGLLYTRYPSEGERPNADLEFYQQIYFHKLGTPEAKDTYVLGKDFPRIAEIALESSDDGKSILAVVANGDGGQHALYAGDVTAQGANLAPIAKLEDKVVAGHFGANGDLLLLSRKGAPRGKLLRLRRPFATAKPEPLLPEGDGVIESFVATRSRLFVVELLGGPSRLRTMRLGHKAESAEVIEPPFPVPALADLRRIGKEDILVRAESYTSAPGWFRASGESKKTAPTALVQPMPYPMDDVEVVRESCTSKDGTEVPLNVLRKNGTPLDGSNPVLLTGYGGYGINRTPHLRPMNRLWIDQGGVFAEANLRGGGEFGESWHEAGKLANKQNVFDDFYACAEMLVRKGYTKPARLAIVGGSNGGLLMGASLVQHPDAVRAVVALVGIYDMLRVETTPNGAFNTTEFGTVKDEKLFRALYAYSPLHHVDDGVAYPAVLFMTGANDPRVDPYNSRKMVARLQEATRSEHPILLRASADTGHGMGTPLDAEVEEDTDMYSFLMNELEMSWH